MKWQWSNVPIPEAHIVGLILGIVLQFFLPYHIFPLPWIGHIIGWPLILFGIAFAGWSVSEAGEINIESPAMLLTGGPYSKSRNPMSVGWSAMYAGIAFVVNSVWLVLLFPVIAVYNHYMDIRKEERLLEEQFGEEYRRYRKRVRRYL